MKCSLTQILTISVIMLLGAAAETLAAGGRYDNSAVFVWGFLALCALIALAQLLPIMAKMIQRATELRTPGKLEFGTSTSRNRAA